MVPCIRRVSLYQTKDPSVLNSKQKYGSKTYSKNISRKFKNDTNHTKIIAPGSKTKDETSKLSTITEDHLRVSEPDLSMTFSEPAVSKQSVSSAVTGTMFEEFNSSNPGEFSTTRRKRKKRKGRSKKLFSAESYSKSTMGQSSPLESKKDSMINVRPSATLPSITTAAVKDSAEKDTSIKEKTIGQTLTS